MSRACAGLLLLAWCLGASAAALPGDSLYQLDIALTTQDGSSTRLAEQRGQHTLVSMFYGSCPHVCPMLVASVQQIERQLGDTQRARLRVLMVSIDPGHDTPQVLMDVAQRHRADLARWTFARAEAGDVRKLAAALGIQYRALADGGFSHSTVITLLDAEGRPLARTAQLGQPEEQFVEALRAALR